MFHNIFDGIIEPIRLFTLDGHRKKKLIFEEGECTQMVADSGDVIKHTLCERNFFAINISWYNAI